MRRETDKAPYKAANQHVTRWGKHFPRVGRQSIDMLATHRTLLNEKDTPKENWAKATNRQFSQGIQTAMKHTMHYFISYIIRQMQTKRIMRACFHPSDGSKLKKDLDGLVCGFWRKWQFMHRQ